MLKRIIFIVSFLTLIFTGCGYFAISEVNTEKPEKILITVLMGESSTDPGIGDLIRETIEEKFPEAELEWENVDWGEQFTPRLNRKISSGETPDIIIGKGQDIHAFYPTGALAALPENLGAYLYPEARDAGTVNGQLYGLVYNQLYQGVIYNKNIFYRYNFNIPETLEDLEKIVFRLNSTGITPYASHFQETWNTGNFLMQCAIEEVFTQQPAWGDLFRNGEVSFKDSDDYRFCAEQVLSIFQNTWMDSINITQSEADLRFSEEKAAMYMTGTWSIQQLQSIAPYRKIGIFPYPTRDGNAKLIHEPNLTFMKSSSTKNSELIDNIFEMLMNHRELAQAVCAFTQTDSGLKDVQVDSLSMIREDIEFYRNEGRIINAAIGNDQLVWAFQYDCAEKIKDYLQGKISFEEAFSFCDELRSESGKFLNQSRFFSKKNPIFFHQSSLK